MEYHNSVNLEPSDDVFDTKKVAGLTFNAAIFQIILLDLVFSIDSIITAVGMTDHVPIMVIAVLVAVAVMFTAATPLAHFIAKTPTVVLLALGFLLMIGLTLIPKGTPFPVPHTS